MGETRHSGRSPDNGQPSQVDPKRSLVPLNGFER